MRLQPSIRSPGVTLLVAGFDEGEARVRWIARLLSDKKAEITAIVERGGSMNAAPSCPPSDAWRSSSSPRWG